MSNDDPTITLTSVLRKNFLRHSINCDCFSVLFCIGDLELAFRRVEFFLQVFTTDFNSFSRGKYKEVRSLVSEESYENYPFRCFGQLAFLASLFFVFVLFCFFYCY